VGTREITIDGARGATTFHNINKILWSVEGADGVKTGYTGKAGKCLVSSASREGKRVICVVLNSARRWDDSKKLLEFGFKNYDKSITLKSQDYARRITIENSLGKQLSVEFGVDIHIPVSQSESDQLSYKIEIPESVKAPVHKGQQIGKLIILSAGKEIFKVPYKAMSNIGI
jgi:D-alanyl-D-alanine carboxypeptidase (penicillin-binding protein 5/6)